jgi:hypothetical protein
VLAEANSLNRCLLAGLSCRGRLACQRSSGGLFQRRQILALCDNASRRSEHDFNLADKSLAPRFVSVSEQVP